MTSLYEHAGGEEALHRLEEAFYSKVLADPVLRKVFTERRPHHVDHLTWFTADSFGGLSASTRELGFQHIVDVLKISDERERFVALYMEALDEAGLPDDEPFERRCGRTSSSARASPSRTRGPRPTSCIRSASSHAGSGLGLDRGVSSVSAEAGFKKGERAFACHADLCGEVGTALCDSARRRAKSTSGRWKAIIASAARRGSSRTSLERLIERAQSQAPRAHARLSARMFSLTSSSSVVASARQRSPSRPRVAVASRVPRAATVPASGEATSSSGP
jgi:hemoglobin